MGSASLPASKVQDAMGQVEIALIELEYAIADFAQQRIDEPNLVNPALILALQEKMRAVEEVFRTVPLDVMPGLTGDAAAR